MRFLFRSLCPIVEEYHGRDHLGIFCWVPVLLAPNHCYTATNLVAQLRGKQKISEIQRRGISLWLSRFLRKRLSEIRYTSKRAKLRWQAVERQARGASSVRGALSDQVGCDRGGKKREKAATAVAARLRRLLHSEQKASASPERIMMKDVERQQGE